jgi:MoaA/NifB/PqqE/SkfB family radical SAM enzyme
MNQLDRVRARVSEIINTRLHPIAARYDKNWAKPTFICCKLSERCNSKCVHCDIWKNQEEDALTTEQWFRTLDNLRQWVGPTYLVLTGGEAFLRRDAMAIIEHATSLGMVCEVLTNGLLTERQHCEALVKAKVAQVTISLDGVTPDTHFAVRRVPGMYEKIVRTVNDLDEFRRQYKASLKILLKMVIMRPNLHEVVAMADWVREQGQADLRYQPIEQIYAQAENLDWFKDSDLWISDVERVKTVVNELVRRKQAGYPIRNTVENLQSMARYFENPEGLMRTVQSHNDRETDTCLVGVSHMVISSNGDVRWCFQMAPAGNVKERTPQGIWETREECWKKPCPWRS